MFTVNEIRQKYIEFFKSKGCKIVQSSSLVPNDPTLLFTNAGMVPFKNYFKGLQKPDSTRITSCQKCVRAGGKHNDLENVGYTARHHTFFEMLGNFSFGDYFKKEAITWAWEFLTEELSLPKENFVVTVHPSDTEAFDIWKNTIKIKSDRIIKLEENFWEMGDTGPCGPCSEIYYDLGPSIAGGLPGTPDEDGDRYLEIWNLVFTQFNRREDGQLENLPHKNIDTGMGLERIATVLQGVYNNFDIDLFRNIISASNAIVGQGDVFSHRIIADHIRSTSFLIADGVRPSNEGRGYVLRRIMRRAILQIYKIRHNHDAIFYKLVPYLIKEMGTTYPELIENQQIIEDTIKLEEQKFGSTLEKGLKILDDKLKNVTGNVLDGKIAFLLYDTYGFPLDLTEMILKEKNIVVSVDDFQKEMQKQKQKSKDNWVGSGDKSISDMYLQIQNTTEFVGYTNKVITSKVLKLIKNNQFVEEVSEGDVCELISEKTVFYGESGGQTGDTGLIILVSKDESIPLPFSIIKVNNTIKLPNGLIIHKCQVENGQFKVGDLINLAFNQNRRKKIAANHSAVHLLHYALRKNIDSNIIQKGSYLDDKRLRLDISFNRPLTSEEISKIEELVNTLILQNTETKTEVLTLEEAKAKGAVALFEEKYKDIVRMVCMGQPITQAKNIKTSDTTCSSIIDSLSQMLSSNKSQFCSMELCGGTHVQRTGDIGFFKIIKEEAVAGGIRRIEALTGQEALAYINNRNQILTKLLSLFKSNENQILDKITGLLKEHKDFKKQIQDLNKQKLNNLIFTETPYGNNKVLLSVTCQQNVNPQDLRILVLTLLAQKYKENHIICIKYKDLILLGISANITNTYNANNILKNLGVKGGGSANFAMGSTDDSDIINSLYMLVKNM